MSQVVYLLASLPHLDITELENASELKDNTLPITEADFLAQCDILGDALSGEVRLAITDVCNSKLAIAKTWSNYEYSIRNEFAKSRWANLRTGAFKPVFVHDSVPVSAEGLDMATFISKESNPLLREQKLIMIKWQILDALDAKSQFKLDNIIIYGWKLQQYLIYRNLSKERGSAQWKNLVQQLSEKAGFSISATTGGF